MSEIKNETVTIPMLALRGLSVFPGMLMTFDVERPASVTALDTAVKADQLIFLATQKDLTADMPEEADIYHVGTVCRIRQQLRQPHGTICRVMVEGMYRAQALSIRTDPKFYTAQIRPLPDKTERVSAPRMEALLRNCLSLFEEYLHLNPEMVTEQILNVLAKPEPVYVSNYIAQNVRLNVDDKQRILESVYPSRRLALLGKLLNNELNVLNIEKELTDATQEQMNQNQREYYLREEMKLIQAELDARREEAASKMGFSAYGVTQSDDPLSMAMRGLIDNASGHEHQIAMLWQAVSSLQDVVGKVSKAKTDADNAKKAEEEAKRKAEEEAQAQAQQQQQSQQTCTPQRQYTYTYTPQRQYTAPRQQQSTPSTPTAPSTPSQPSTGGDGNSGVMF